MFSDSKIWVANSASGERLYLEPSMANRHGIIAGATGTGKTITMKVLAESFSDMGVPVFFSDVKGDLSGMCTPGVDSEDMQKRIEKFGIENFTYKNYPTRFWDIFGENGNNVRVTVSDMGPTLLAKLFELTDVQAGVLNIVFRVADEQGLELIDLKDLRAMVSFVGENRAEFSVEYGNVTVQSIGAIQRALLKFEDEGGSNVFGEPMLDIRDFIRTDINGRGYINILSSVRIIQSPAAYASFLLWMLSELFEKLPEVGDVEKPRLVFFFDEAHMLFSDCSKALLQKIVQLVKLIRSKGVGVYFVTQSPSDIPDEVLAQLSNRVQHGLRAYTPSEQKAVRAAANAFRENPEFNTQDALMALGTGEALVSFLDKKGIPSIVENAKILPPQSLMGAAAEETVAKVIQTDEFALKYNEEIDRETAYEIIMAAKKKIEEEKAAEEELKAAQEAEKKAEAERLKAEAEEQKRLAAEERERKKAQAEEQKKLAAEEREEKKRKAAEEKEAQKAQKEKDKKKKEVSKAAQKAVTSATSSVARSVSTNMVNSLLGGKQTSAQTMAKRAATNALSSVMRTGATAIIRGFFGTKK
ncbi:MAG: DUF853 family protein [Clostridia bacterium]|nr:DUF853 family protein [Clostridia bacterium]MBR0120374.1 DUF853 family protein [Clostridia bacterium]